MTYSTFGGDPDDTGFLPVSPTLLGAVCVFLSAVFGGAFVVAGQLGGDGLGAAGFWVIVGGGTLGLALICWDQLTDFFESAPPPGSEPDDEAADGVGEPVDDLSDVGQADR